MATERALPAAEDAAFEVLAAAVEPVAPPPGLRDRLMDAVRGEARHAPFAGDLAARFDLPVADVRGLLARLSTREAWTPGIGPLLGHFNFRPGPRLAGLRGGFVRMTSGGGFPLHRHVDREIVYVLEGELVDGDGARYRPGDTLDMAPGSSHSLRVGGDEPALFALLHGGIEMLAT